MQFLDLGARVSYIAVATLFLVAAAIVAMTCLGHRGGPRGR